MKNEKKVIIGLIIGFLLISVLSWISQPEIKDYIRFGFTLLICFFLYTGKNWARWLMGILSGLAALVVFLFVFKYELEPEILAVLALMGSFYAVAAYILISKKFILTHFEKQE